MARIMGNTGQDCRNAPKYRALTVALGLALGMSQLALAPNAQAQTATAQQYELPSQPLGAALNRLAVTADRQLLAPPELVRGRTAPALTGRYTMEEALQRLLAGSGLTYRIDARGVITIQREPASPAAPSTNRSPTSGQAPQDSRQEEIVHLPGVMVQGTRTLNMDIQRSVDDPQPYVIFDRSKIERSGARNVQDFLKNNLTMNTTMVSPSQTIGGFGGDSTSINLRGLGANQTLILVDGRRIANVMLGFAPQQPDLNGIPLSAIERIEVLPSTASGIYGGGATGGVVNVILRRDYQGMEAKVVYENTFHTDSALRQFDLSAGFSLEQGRTSILLAATYLEKDPLQIHERDLAQRAHSRILANNPSYILSNPIMPRGYTTNIRSVNGSNLVLRHNNTPLNSSFTYVPVGYAGPQTDNGMALVANAGQFNPDLSTTPQGGFTLPGGAVPFYHSPTVETVTATVRRSFSPKVDAFLEVFNSDNESKTFLNSFNGSFTLPVSAPNNPFTTPIQVLFPDSSANGISYSRINTRRMAGGVIAKLPHNWLGAIDYTWSRASVHWSAPAGSIVPSAITGLITSGTVDVMRDVNVYGGLSPTVWPSYGQKTVEPFLSTTRNSTLRFAGPSISLPAGDIILSAALEYRDDQLSSGINRVLLATGFDDQFTPARSQSVASGYVEARIPLVGPDSNVPFMQELEVQLAGRHDSYETEGATGRIFLSADPTGETIIRVKNKMSSTNPTVALRYSMNEAATLRASYGTGFLPPAVNQLAPNLPASRTNPFSDPRRGDTGPVAAYTVLTGGNPQLKPEESKNWSIGLILTPQLIRGLRLSVDYSQFTKTDNIANVTVQQIIDNEAFLPDRVIRGANLPTDPVGWAGPITAVDSTMANISEARIKAYDVQMDYPFELPSLGSFELFAIGTWQDTYSTRFSPTSEFVENVGFRDQPLYFKANAGITWLRGQWTAGWNTQYFDSYQVYGPTDAPATVATLSVTQGNGGRVSSQIYHEVFGTYRFESMKGMQLQFGVNNLLGSKPPVDILNSNGGYSLYGDPRLRRLYLSLKMAF